MGQNEEAITLIFKVLPSQFRCLFLVGQNTKDWNIRVRSEVKASTSISLYQLFINWKRCMVICQIMHIDHIAHETVCLTKGMTTLAVCNESILFMSCSIFFYICTTSYYMDQYWMLCRSSIVCNKYACGLISAKGFMISLPQRC